METKTTYTPTDLNDWNRQRLGQHTLNSLTVTYLSDPEITDRDRIAFALNELRKADYEVEACPVDWTKPKMICSLDDSPYMAFGDPVPSQLQRRLLRIGRRAGVENEFAAMRVAADLYDEDDLFDTNEYAFLEEPYEFAFKGSPSFVEAVFQTVGFATRLAMMCADDGSETHYAVRVAPASRASE